MKNGNGAEGMEKKVDEGYGEQAVQNKCKDFETKSFIVC